MNNPTMGSVCYNGGIPNVSPPNRNVTMRTEYYTTTEAADYLGVSVSRVVQFCQEGRIGRKIGRNWAISRDEAHRFFLLRRKPGRPLAAR